ncbi:hypothetical protein HLH36_01105 [Gluconacetobacter aggeris]|uniref:Uncharacterized protein n=1 Tax=Gluconacetobacter aggeris TaxID=1286186 RepID=A0A7W4NXV2_9PROT|nr:hypothetical protein [Gluconacetobacter aggeris]MBB2166965.1 hypothetical protein [Gluconacetobacter aggeris]
MDILPEPHRTIGANSQDMERHGPVSRPGRSSVRSGSGNGYRAAVLVFRSAHAQDAQHAGDVTPTLGRVTRNALPAPNAGRRTQSMEVAIPSAFRSDLEQEKRIAQAAPVPAET